MNDVGNMYEAIFDLHKERIEMEREENFQMIHILFGASTEGSLRMALKGLGLSKIEKIISFWDMFSVGPIWQLHEKVGEEARFTWMKNVMNNEDFQDYINRFQESVNQINAIQTDIPITIWIADSSHEQTGLRYALRLLKNKDNDIKVINTTNKHGELFKQKDIEYILLHTGEINAEKLQIMYEQSKDESPLSELVREELEGEWVSLSNHQETLRIWKDGKIQSVSEDYYDQFMIHRAKYLHSQTEQDGFMKSARLIGDVLGHLEQYVGDSFLEYRLRKLIDAGIFESKGNLKAMRLYSVRLT